MVDDVTPFIAGEQQHRGGDQSDDTAQAGAGER